MHQETFIGGVWHPSVTTILGIKPKPYLDKWFNENPVWAPRKVAAANAIGTDFHGGVEGLIAGTYTSRRFRRSEAMVGRWVEWAGSVSAIIDHTELRVVSHKHRYSGTLDAVGTLDGEPTVFDWKTSSGIYDDMALQLSAYANAYEEMTGIKCKRGLIVLVSKDKPDHKLTVKEYKLDRRLFNQFLKRLEEFRAAVVEPGGAS